MHTEDYLDIDQLNDEMAIQNHLDDEAIKNAPKKSIDGILYYDLKGGLLKMPPEEAYYFEESCRPQTVEDYQDAQKEYYELLDI